MVEKTADLRMNLDFLKERKTDGATKKVTKDHSGPPFTISDRIEIKIG